MGRPAKFIIDGDMTMHNEVITKMNRAEAQIKRVAGSPVVKTIPGLSEALESLVDVVQVVASNYQVLDLEYREIHESRCFNHSDGRRISYGE